MEIKQTISPSLLQNFRQLPCSKNQITVKTLFQWYDKCGLLYEEKKKKLLHAFPQIFRNYQEVLKYPELAQIFTYVEPQSGAVASMTSLRTSKHAWFGQHLIASNNAKYASAVVFLQTVGENEKDCLQLVFRGDNKFPNRLYGAKTIEKINKEAGHPVCSINEYTYISIPRNLAIKPSDSVEICPFKKEYFSDFQDLMLANRDPICIKTEGWLDDFDLQGVNAISQNPDMHWRRRVWLAFLASSSKPVGAVALYEAPLGLNFRFLFNRFDPFLDPQLSLHERKLVCSALIQKVVQTASPSNISDLPGLINPNLNSIVKELGGNVQHAYYQECFLPEGAKLLFLGHLERYKKVLNRYAFQN